jgi:hypothetical protein
LGLLRLLHDVLSHQNLLVVSGPFTGLGLMKNTRLTDRNAQPGLHGVMHALHAHVLTMRRVHLALLLHFLI